MQPSRGGRNAGLTSRPSVDGDHGAAGDAVLRRGQEQDGCRDLLDLRPGGMVGLGHGLAVRRSVEGRRRDRVHQYSGLHDLLGQREGHGGDRGLAGAIGDHARAGAPLECRAGRDVDDAPARAGAGHRLDRRTAAQECGHEVHIHLLHQVGLRGLADRRHGEAAGDMDRGPQGGHARIKPRHRTLVSQLAIGDQMHLGMLAQREAFGFSGVDEGHVADSTGLDQCAHHGGAEGAGPAGDDDMTVAIVHRFLLLMQNYPHHRLPEASRKGKSQGHGARSHLELFSPLAPFWPREDSSGWPISISRLSAAASTAPASPVTPPAVG